MEIRGFWCTFFHTLPFLPHLRYTVKKRGYVRTMKVAAIIAEYNPFHNGHRYQIRQIREAARPDYIVVVMSGDYVQRGAPALLEKHVRAQMALTGGADLVLELPVRCASASAPDFAKGAVSILASIGVTDTLYFGSESGNIGHFEAIADILEEEPPVYKAALKSALSAGRSYPAASQEALLAVCRTRLPGLSKEEIAAFLKGPNNALGLAYVRAIKHLRAGIRPVALKRTSDNYHDTSLAGAYASATALRKQLLEKENPGRIAPYVPPAVFDTLINAKRDGTLLTENDFSVPLKYALLFGATAPLEHILGLGEGLANRITNRAASLTSFSEFTGTLKSKNQTYASISRALLHIVLGIRADVPAPEAIRILGFRREAAGLLRAIKEHCSRPVFTRLAGVPGYETDIRASNLAHYLRAQKSGRLPADERSLPPVII